MFPPIIKRKVVINMILKEAILDFIPEEIKNNYKIIINSGNGEIKISNELETLFGSLSEESKRKMMRAFNNEFKEDRLKIKNTHFISKLIARFGDNDYDTTMNRVSYVGRCGLKNKKKFNAHYDMCVVVEKGGVLVTVYRGTNTTDYKAIIKSGMAKNKW